MLPDGGICLLVFLSQKRGQPSMDSLLFPHILLFLRPVAIALLFPSFEPSI